MLNLEDAGRRDEIVDEDLEVLLLQDRSDRIGLLARAGAVALTRKRFAARIMPGRLQERGLRARRRKRQRLGGSGELRVGVIGRRLDRRGERHGDRHIDGDFRVELSRHLQRRFAIAGHLRRRHHEVHVVNVIPELEHRALGAERERRFVRLHRVYIEIHRLLVAPDPRIGVRGHVDEMAEAGRQAGQAIRIRNGAKGIRRRLRRVDIEVDRRLIVRVALEDRLQQRQRLAGAAFRRSAVGLPVIPGLRVHVRLRRR